MRISIDATGLGAAKTGTAVYITEILREWNLDRSIAHEFIIFGNDHTQAHCVKLELDSRFSFIMSPRSRYLRALWQQVTLPAHIRRLGIDAHWGTGFVLPLASRTPRVVTIHDMTHQLFPEVHEHIKRYYFPALIKASVNAAQAVIAVSNATKMDLHRLIPSSRTKTITTLLAARDLSEELPTRGVATQGPATNYMLSVGTVEPRKNLARLISAWRRLDAAARGDTQLIVVGAKGWLVNEPLNSNDREYGIQFKGHVTDAELFNLLRHAKALLYPSLYEGFGLPILEAMMAGTPVLTSDIGATQEIAAGASVLVDPTNEDQIREGLTRLLVDPELLARLSTLGKARAKEFSWRRTARETLAVIERAAIYE
ncbi:Glycosyltransferase involved in cell wall bisynthesis [Bradyrhizobium shewense]|uniref:Glycosyltransferase involved in cell wall bisynthesis n=1 Tax=Bradyrhizobium shewense TaxID=1761772 RepID=A0A1C3WRU8_9BRAD|nr:glycosyltransferase family 1 protein [Bradyrhizobium shewense]SCB42625.1 Glycosyltransferase involved in cell wall bisynthesis [Bradyrhizobium shewense]